MVAALFDTNILLDYLRGFDEARRELELYDKKFISLITWMEVMAGVAPDHEEQTRRFLTGFNLISPDEQVAARAVKLRRDFRIKLSDAIIWASAECYGLLLVTRNVKDFPEDTPGVRCPYNLVADQIRP